MHNLPSNQWLRQVAMTSLRLIGAIAAYTFIGVAVVEADPPGWWYDSGVIDPTQTANDYAAANQGQVKFIASQAAAELNAYLPGGAGAAVNALVATWTNPTGTTNDYAAVDLGQLKVLAKPFYDQLIAVGYTSVYPWNAPGLTANDYAVANIGQVKNLFSFDPTAVTASNDSNGDGLPDWWEKYYHLTGVTASSTVPWNANLTYLQALQQGLNPNDYYNGQAPTLAIVSGTPQTGSPGGFVPAPLIISVADINGNPLTNAPVTFTVGVGGGQLQVSSISTPVAAVTALTNINGQAQVFFRLPNILNNTSQVIAAPGSGRYSVTAIFSLFSDGGGNTYGSPFAPSNVVASMNADGSGVITWTNNADPNDPTPINVECADVNGNIVIMATVPAGTTSYPFTAH